MSFRYAKEIIKSFRTEYLWKDAPYKRISPMFHQRRLNFRLSIMWTIMGVLLGFPLILVIILLFLITAIRQCQINHRNPNSCKLVNAADAYWLQGTECYLNNVQILVYVAGDLSANELQILVNGRLLNKVDKTGKPVYARFVQTVKRDNRTQIWFDYPHFDIKQHIYDEDKVFVRKKEFEVYLSGLIATPLNPNRPLWEFRVVRNFGTPSEPVTALIIRVHHSLADGPALMHIFSKCLADHRRERRKIRNTAVTWNLSTKFLIALITGSLRFLSWLIFFSQDYNHFSQVKSTITEKKLVWSRRERLSAIYRIRRRLRCALSDVIMFAISGALRKYLLERGIKNPPDVTANIPIDLRSQRNNTGALGSSYSTVSMTLPVNTEGLLPRLWRVRCSMRDLKSSAEYVIMKVAIFFMYNLLPVSWMHWVLTILYRRATVTCFNVAGPDYPVFLDGRKVQQIICWMHVMRDCPLTFCFLSYCGTYSLSLSANGDTVPMCKYLLRECTNQVRRLVLFLEKRHQSRSASKRTGMSTSVLMELEKNRKNIAMSCQFERS